MNGVQTRFKCKLDVKRCKRFVFPPSSLLPRSNALKTKAIRYFQTDRTLTRIVSPPLYGSGSNGGQIDVEFTEMEKAGSVSRLLYSSLPDDKDANGNYLVTMGLFDTVLYDVVEIPDMKEYTMRITLNDPAASISKDFRIQVDYILFEPIN